VTNTVTTPSPLLAPLTPAERSRVLEAAVTRRFARGETVVREGELGESLHIVRSGRLAVRVSTPAGATATLSVLSAGDAFGELALLNKCHVRTATVVALEQSETLALSRGAFEALRRGHPAVERVVTEALARRVQELSSALLEALFVPVDRRVVARLVDLGRTYGDGARHDHVTVPITQDDLADMVGTTRPTTNQVLQRLADEGVLTLGRGRIVLTDLESLRARAASWGYY
jgi:CRP/FNR family transcriptional regulator, cyclic AMP receptor protein